MESNNSPAQFFNANSNLISNESSGRKNDKYQEEKNLNTESHIEKTHHISSLKDNFAPSSTIKNKFDFNINNYNSSNLANHVYWGNCSVG